MTPQPPNTLKGPTLICGGLGLATLAGAAVANDWAPYDGRTKWPAILTACGLLLWVAAFLLWVSGTHTPLVANDRREFFAAQRLALDPAGLTTADQAALADLDTPVGDLDDLIRAINTHVAREVPAPRRGCGDLTTAERRQPPAPVGATAEQCSTARALVYSAMPAELDNTAAREVATTVVGLLLDLGWRPQGSRLTDR